jgi:hypothetical protein
MPPMAVIDLLSRTVDRLPDAKQVLLTTGADTDAAIRAINEVKLDYYLLKPWDPPASTAASASLNRAVAICERTFGRVVPKVRQLLETIGSGGDSRYDHRMAL